MTDEKTNVHQETSLTAPHDRTKPYKSGCLPRELNDDEVQMLSEELNVTSILNSTENIRLERKFMDPTDAFQTIGLFSFIPSKGASPDKNGIYGFAKLRGNFATKEEANSKAEEIIRSVDSYHKIYHCRVGYPFPLTVSSRFSQNINEVDFHSEVSKGVKQDLKDKRREERKVMDEIKEREIELLEDVKNHDSDEFTIDDYITTHVKKAQIYFTLLETKKKIEEMKSIVRNALEKIREMDTEHPEFKEEFMERYIHARKKSGFKEDNVNNTFMTYMSDRDVDEKHLKPCKVDDEETEEKK